MQTPNLHDWRPSESQAKLVTDTKMLNTEAHETVDLYENNVVGKELVNEHVDFGKLGAQGRY